MAYTVLNPRAAELLANQQWKRPSAADVESLRALLIQKGFALNPFAEEYLRAFAGLTVRIPGVIFKCTESELNDYLEPELLPHFSLVCEAPSCPVACCADAYVVAIKDRGYTFIDSLWNQWFEPTDLPTVMDWTFFWRDLPNPRGFFIPDHLKPEGYNLAMDRARLEFLERAREQFGY